MPDDALPPTTSFGAHLRIALAAGAIVATAAAVVVFAYPGLLLAFVGFLFGILLDDLAAAMAARTPLSRTWAARVVAVAALAVLAVVVPLVGGSLAESAGQLVAALPHAAERARDWVPWLSWSGAVVDPSAGVRRVAGLFSTATGAAAAVLVAVFIGIYAALAPDLYASVALGVVPPADRERIRERLGIVVEDLRRWLRTRCIDAAAFGCVTAALLGALGLHHPAAAGVGAAALAFAPIAGPLATALLVGVAASQLGWVAVGAVVASYAAAEWVLRRFGRPIAGCREPGPALTLSAQVVMGAVAGVLGVLVAAPLVVFATSILQRRGAEASAS